MTNAERVAHYVRNNPGVGVNDVCRRFDVDGGTAWSYLIDAERAGLITSDNSNGGKWRFDPR